MRLALVPLDGSALSDSVLGHVERLLGQEPSDLHLLRVMSAPSEVSSGQVLLERDAAEAHLAATRARLEGRGGRVTTELRDGDPATEILAAVAERSPALVAMSTHGRSGIPRWILGSVAERVARSCTAPVLLVTPNAEDAAKVERLRRILVPLDGAERSASILPLVEDLARRHEAEVLLLRVEWEGLTRPMLAATLDPEKVADSLKPWLERLTAHGVSARALVAQGDAATEILSVADREGVDLVAMATHGKMGLERLVDGSVSELVLRHGKRPLLVLRAP